MEHDGYPPRKFRRCPFVLGETTIRDTECIKGASARGQGVPGSFQLHTGTSML